MPESIVPKLNLWPLLSEHAEESFSSSTPLRPSILRSMGHSKALNSSHYENEIVCLIVLLHELKDGWTDGGT